MKLALSAILILTLLPFSGGVAQSHPAGSAIFNQQCAACHRDTQRTLAPSIAALSQMSRSYILRTLETGKMESVGRQLTRSQRMAVAEFLSASEPDPVLPKAAYCTAPNKPGLNDAGWKAWGVDAENTRYVPEAVAKLPASDVPSLRLKWAFGFPGASATFGQPTVFGGRVYAGNEEGTVYSLDARTGCLYWAFSAPATVKTAITPGFGGRMVFFGDVAGNIYAVNTATGKLAWKRHVDPQPQARITGSPVFFENNLYVPVSSGEEGAAIDPKYPCCTFRGSLVALNARTGKTIWQTHTIPDAAGLTGGKNSAGTPMWGPSGGAVWSPPTIDARKRVIYVADSNSYSDPDSPYTDAVIAFRMSDGKMLWHEQFTANDVWNIACVAPGKVNCPAKPGTDFDFGAPPILRTLPNGKRILIAAQKSGVVYGLDPDQNGKVVWKTRIGKGGPLGGVEWGGAAHGNAAYFPLSDWDPNSAYGGGGMFALNAATGARIWYQPPPTPACAKQTGCSAAQSSPPTLIPGVVFSGSEDGYLRAYDTASGKLVWEYDVLRSFRTVDGVPAQGGSMNATGPAIVNGILYVEAGYTNNIAGNVLLAFSASGK